MQSNGQSREICGYVEKCLGQMESGGSNGRSDNEILHSIQNEHSPHAEWKTSAEVLIGRTARTIGRSMLSRGSSSQPENCRQRVTFDVGDSVLVRDFRLDHTWTAGTVIRRRGSVAYELQVNNEAWIRQRSQLKKELLEKNFKLITHTQNGTSEGTLDKNQKAAKGTAN